MVIDLLTFCIIILTSQFSLSILYCFDKSSFFPIQNAKHTSLYFPGGQYWYDMRTGTAYKGGVTYKLEVSDESVPAFQRAGTIIPRKDRYRRSSTQMVNDPYTLVSFYILTNISF